MSSSISLPDPDLPQVLLFGHSGAGKSALLGALFQAGEKQGDILRGEVLETSGRLSSIRDAIYRGTELERTHSELVTYHVRIRPWRIGAQVLGEPLSLLLHDCSGKAAESLIRHPDSIHDPETRAPVAHALINADAIVLLVDGSEDDRELIAAFVEFNAFLKVVAMAKATAREVGGFPVFLVLTQCDKLAGPLDSRTTWEARVERRAEQAWEKFHSFLKDAAHEDEFPAQFLPFGSIELMVYGVAVRHPRLTDAPGQPALPYHVAELFRDCFAAAKLHRARVGGSNRRLGWTLRAAITFVALLLLGSIGMVVFQPPKIDFQLADRVAAYQMHEQPASIRLAEPNLSQNRQALAAFRHDPGFFTLREDQQEFIDSRLKEIDDYKKYCNRLNAATIPGETRSLDELARVDRELHAELALPASYSWEETPAGILRDKYLEDVRAIQRAENAFQNYYRDLIRRGINALTLTTSFGGNWRQDVNALLAEGSRPPAVLNEPLNGSPAVNAQRGEAVTNRVPYEFDRVYLARKDWESTSERLRHLRDLADALGLTAGIDRPDAVLLLPEPGPGVDSVALPSLTWTALKRTFGYLDGDYSIWYLSNFPDPGRAILAERLNQCFRTGLQHVRTLVLSRLGPEFGKKDTPENWRKLADLLTDPVTAFPEWGRLLALYARLLDPSGQNPVVELAAFLRTPSFALSPKGFELSIPADLSAEKTVPNGALVISEGTQPLQSKRYKQVGEGVRNGSSTSFRFVPETEGKLSYTPGDVLRAELPVRSGMQEFKLVWEGGSSRTFPFDLFARQPRLVKPGGTSEPAVGVKLALTPGSVWPQLPALFSELMR